MATSDAQSQANMQSLYDKGYTPDQVSSFNYGAHLSSGELQSFIQQTGPSAVQQLPAQIGALASQQYQFDPNQYLPGIQAQANAIYSPQQAQLQALRDLQTSQYQSTKIQNEKDFQKAMQQTIESINNRGAFFSGGGIQAQNDLQGQFNTNQQQNELQYNAAQFSNLAQQGQLAADKAQFIQDRLYNAESSAYARWTDQRNFSMSALQTQYQIFSSERSFVRSVFESDRAYDLSVEEMNMKQKQFEQTYKINEEQYKQAKEEFNIDMKIKNLSYEQAMDKFKSKYAVDNSGIFGLDVNGNDVEQSLFNGYTSQDSSFFGGGLNYGLQPQTNDGGIITFGF